MKPEEYLLILAIFIVIGFMGVIIYTDFFKESSDKSTINFEEQAKENCDCYYQLRVIHENESKSFYYDKDWNYHQGEIPICLGNKRITTCTKTYINLIKQTSENAPKEKQE